MMAAMTEPGLPIVDGAIACPFVAFEGDRDSRATSPDHLHRCYAEVRPAPRALAHQQAYCLSSAFAVCQTFQDWARREAAQARSDSTSVAAAADGDGHQPTPDGDGPVRRGGPERNPPRDWASPPPWMGEGRRAPLGADDADDQPDVVPIPPRGGGLAGSFADRVAGQPASRQPSERGTADSSGAERAAQAPAEESLWREPAELERQPAGRMAEAVGDEPGADVHGDVDDDRPATPRSRRAGRSQLDRTAPSWERLPRREAYPTLKTRMGLSGVSMSPMLVAVAALVIAAIALFALPAILGVGNPPSTPGPSLSAGPSAGSASPTPLVPTPVPEPTQQIYVVQAGDTMSRIANRFGVPLAVLCDTNKATIPNCDKVVVGQNVIIPSVAPTTVPGASSSPEASATP